MSSQRADLKDALYNALKDGRDDVNPLVQNGQKLIPSVTRVFSKGHNLYIYLHAYEQGAPAIQPLFAAASLYNGREKGFETRPVMIAEGLNDRLKTMPVLFDIPLGELAPGRYDCQVTVLEPAGQRAAFWQAPILVVP